MSVLFAACAPEQPDGAIALPPSVGAGPIRRLTPSAYANAVRDLFPGVEVPPVDLVADPLVLGFDNQATAQAPSALLVQQYQEAAIAVTAAAVADAERAFGCPVDGGADPLGCGEAFLWDLAARSFRRPVDDDELAPWLDLFREALEAEGFEVAVQLAAQGLLQSPEFLYLPEFGRPVGTDPVVPLAGFEVATRLSLLLWNSIPDEALRLAAADGSLDDVHGIEAEVGRMLDDPRAADGIANFHRLWLALDGLALVRPDPGTYPAFDEAMRDAMRAGTDEAVEALWLGSDDGTVAGLPELLLEPAFLAIHAHEVHPSPVLRGVFVLERFLCSAPPPPPADADTTPPEDVGGETNRERYAAHSANEACSACHAQIDPIGFGFEHYDAIGAWRDLDAGHPIDATGAFATGDLAGLPFDGAEELVGLLATSRTVSDCMATQWLRYALGREPMPEDEAGEAAVQAALDASGGRLRELLVEVSTSDPFRFRRAE